MAGVVPGTLKVSNDCIADLAGYAALECYGVVGMAVIVEQGVNMASVVNNLTSSVKFILKQIAELDDVKVTVHIEGLRSNR